MKTEKEIKEKIKELEFNNKYLLEGELSTIVENAPRALMQLQTISQLRGLYFTLDEKCPQYIYERKSDDKNKKRKERNK